MDKRLKSTGYFHATVRVRLYCPAVSSHASQLALSKCLAFILVIFQPVELFFRQRAANKEKTEKVVDIHFIQESAFTPKCVKKVKNRTSF